MDTSKVNRLELIDHTRSLEDGGGRTVVVGGPAYGKPDDIGIELSLQDDGRTLKVFISKKEQPSE